MDFPKVTIILRGYTYEQVKNVVEMLVASERNNSYGVEITLNSPDVFTTLRKITMEYGKDCLIGAGTILNLEDAEKAVESGAQFILSPIKLEKEVLDYCRDNNIISVPAAMTPTEVAELNQNGANIIKVFPATAVGASFFKDIQAPLGNLHLMAVGGISSDNINDYLESGASYVGIGSGIFNKKDVVEGNRDNMMISLNDFEKKVLIRGEG